MTDDIIRSMKEQMVPSDDVVSDLLAKIAAFEASPETIDNVDSFENFRKADDIAAAVVSEKKASKAKKFTTKSIWYYGTAAAASVIVLLSVFSVLGGTDPSDIKNVVDGVVREILQNAVEKYGNLQKATKYGIEIKKLKEQNYDKL